MENFANIKFDGNLTRNKTCKITYSGFLFENGSTSVTIVYGFNLNWENTDAKEMTKTDDGFCIEINMQDYELFNFCFRNSNYEWDNNYNNNYTVSILENNENIDTPQDNNLQNQNTLNSDLIANTETNNDISSFEVTVLNNQSMNIEDTLVNSTEETNLNSDIENLFENIYNNSSKSKEVSKNTSTSTTNVEEFSMDSLIDEILSPIVSSSIFEESKSITNNSENYNQNNLEDLKQDNELDNNVDTLINNLISDIYTSTINIEEKLNNDNNIFSDEIENVEMIEENPLSPIIESTNNDDKEDYNSSSEESLVDTIKTLSTIDKNDSKSNELTVSSRTLSKFYLIKKKVKIAFYRFLKVFYKGTNSTEI